MIKLNNELFDPADVVHALQDHVTPVRLQKIRDVVAKRNNFLATVVENLYDRGNTSAVMRSSEAFGFHQFHHIESIEQFKESKRVTKGADKWLMQNKWPNTTDCISHLKKQGYAIYVTQLEGGKPIEELSFEKPVALCFGSERDGASKELSSLADEKVYIPMDGFVQSFNISVAAALCFQHIHRIHKSLKLGLLSPQERTALEAHYLYRSCQNPTPHLQKAKTQDIVTKS